MAMGDGCQPESNSDLLKSSARPNNTWFINTRLMSSELRLQVRGARIVPTGNQAVDHAHGPIRSRSTTPAATNWS